MNSIGRDQTQEQKDNDPFGLARIYQKNPPQGTGASQSGSARTTPAKRRAPPAPASNVNITKKPRTTGTVIPITYDTDSEPEVDDDVDIERHRKALKHDVRTYQYVRLPKLSRAERTDPEILFQAAVEAEAIAASLIESGKTYRRIQSLANCAALPYDSDEDEGEEEEAEEEDVEIGDELGLGDGE
jgi:hypothetical protein